MPSFKRILNIWHRELQAMANNPATYITLIVFLLLWEFLFWRNFFLIGESSLHSLLGYLPWLSLLLIPALTMGSIAQEKSEGTIEMLLTHPTRELEVVLGKYLATISLVGLILLIMIPIGIGVSWVGPLDWGVFIAQLIAALLMSSVLVALGLCVSSFFTSQIAALLTSAVATIFLIILGSEFVTGVMPLWLGPILEHLSVLSHFNSMSRGVLDIRDLWYAISATAVFLSIAYLHLLAPKISNRASQHRQYQVMTILIIAIAVVSNVIGDRIPGRLDLTSQAQYTLSPVTKETLANLPDLVQVNVYVSSQIPAQLQPVLRDVKDILRDYTSNSHGKLNVRYKDPDTDETIASEAKNNGVVQVQFNVVGQSELQLKKGYFGLSVTHAGYHNAIPIIQDTSDFEYQLTSFIKKLTITKKPKIAYLRGHDEKKRQDYQKVEDELEKSFDVTDIDTSDGKTEIPVTVTGLIIAGPQKKLSDKEVTQIKKFVDNGGSLFLMIDAMNTDSKQLLARANVNSLSSLAEFYGVTVNKNLAYDLKSNQTVNVNQGPVTFVIPYPYWLKALPVRGASPIVSRLASISLPWTSSISINDAQVKSRGYISAKLFQTSDQGGVQGADSIDVNPSVDMPKGGFGQQLLAVSLQPEKSDDKRGRIVILGTSNVFVDEYLQRAPENLAFGIESTSWLLQDAFSYN
ncbi:Gldg family protein [Candidatus Uhrbacteria bacterium]|nr:Gldg family protein [Candidatus Uhrbacteria bacterium]